MIEGEGMPLLAVTGTGTTGASVVIVFLHDIVASQHGELGLLQDTPELGVARVGEVDGAQLGLVTYSG